MAPFDLFLRQLEIGLPKVVVVGGGYVGLPLAVTVARAGCDVVVLDVDEARVKAINHGASYIVDVPSSLLAEQVVRGHLRATRSLGEAYCAAQVVLICVPTPLKLSREPNLAFVTRAVDGLVENLTATAPQLLVVLESTVYPGFTQLELGARLQDRLCLLDPAGDHKVYVAFSPERVDPANRTFHIGNTPKVVGGVDADATRAATAFYARFAGQVVPVSSADAAELTKLLENTFRAVNIALANEFAMAAHRLGVDIWEVAQAAATKPYGFMPFSPGPGVGGECLPCDPPYLSWRMRGLDQEMRLLDTAILVNRSMPAYVVRRVAAELNADEQAVRGRAILVVGMAYKAGVGDVRESPALAIAAELARQGARIAYYDPHVPSVEVDGCKLCSVEKRLVAGPDRTRYDAIVVATDHPDVDLAEIVEGARLVFDTRNATAGMTAGTGCRIVRL